MHYTRSCYLRVIIFIIINNIIIVTSVLFYCGIKIRREQYCIYPYQKSQKTTTKQQCQFHTQLNNLQEIKTKPKLAL